MGENPRRQGRRWNTDLPGGYEAAFSTFVGLSRLDGIEFSTSGGFHAPSLLERVRRPTAAFISDAGHVALRPGVYNGEIAWRIDIDGGTFYLPDAETIHFNGEGQGQSCPI